MSSCKGSCDFIDYGYHGNPKYMRGYRYCTTCMFSMITEEFLCPCCKTTLRRKARNKIHP